MNTTQGVQAGVSGAKGGSGTSIPSSVVGFWGEFIGSSTDAITPDATTGKKLIYCKMTRTATGDGDLMGNGAGGVAMSIAGDVVSMTDGTNTTHIPVHCFSAVDDQVILILVLDADGTMIVGRYEG